MIGFYLGGLVAMAGMTIGGALSGDEPLGVGDVIAAIIWPVTVVAFLVDVARGWRP